MATLVNREAWYVLKGRLVHGRITKQAFDPDISDLLIDDNDPLYGGTIVKIASILLLLDHVAVIEECRAQIRYWERAERLLTREANNGARTNPL